MTIPESLLKRNPELAAIMDAVVQHRAGEPITARCDRCNNPMVVAEVAAVGALHVTCPCGHIKYRSQRDKSLI